MINYAQFKEILEYFIDKEKFVDDFRILLYKYDKRDFIDPYCFQDEKADNYIILLLESMFQDSDKWISYFIYELDCGKAWKTGLITDSSGADIKLKTIKDLWVLLQENMNDHI